MELSQNNISTIVSMIVPFIAYVIAKLWGFDIDQATLTMFLTGVVELIVLIWSARNPNTLAIFGNNTSAEEIDDEAGVDDEH